LSSISSPGEIHSVSSHEHHLNKPVLLGGKIESSATDKKVQFAENLTTHIKDVSEEGTIKNVKPIASQSPFSGVVVEKHTNELEERSTMKQRPRSSEFKRTHQSSSS
jgi:hypothetical protein